MPSVDELKAQGNAALQNNDTETAIKAYSEAIALDPKNHVLYSNRSAAYAQKSSYSDALADAEKCIEIKPDWVKGYTRKATALEFLERFSEAEIVLNRALEMDPNSQMVKDSLQTVKKGIIYEKTKESVASNPKLAHYLNDPDYCKNLKSFFTNPAAIATLLSDPRMKDTFEHLYMSEMDTSEPTSPPNREPPPPSKAPEPEKPKLSDEQQKALQEKDLGNAAYKKKDFETALKHYDAAIALEPNNVTFHSNKTAVYFEMKDYDQCLKICEEAIEIGREHRADYKLIARLLARMGSCHEAKGELQAANKFYGKSLSEFRSPDVIKKAQTLKKLLDEAEKQAYINPELAEEEKKQGNKAFTDGRYPVALQHYTEAIKRNPTEAKLYSNRAACYSKLMEFPSALSDCEKCLELDPNFVKGYLRKGACHIAMKDLYQAKKAYSKALELDPECGEARDGLRQTYTSDVDPEQARQKALNDPEIMAIMSDPAMRMILNQMEDPKAVREHLANPEIAAKFAKLVDAGLVSIR
ncbi:Stress-induced-phosphoprotein 1 [Cichlidogyrus casuarinus]|uniref:Stress-induced-phosphoprotein 1 n=1 Tax=Cichlidogyrus casuarinus TaxID=1844966 RepID=A0ABD2QN52_9PLAT